ncbi:Rad17-domain-containing protein [Hypoxylon cercidicola]|nr:Rad17-domain-containing protein [Hypoxylon cercidicola]
MAPPTKRRRRNIVHASSDDEEESKPKTNTLNNYLFSSPERPSASAAHASRPTTSPSPARKSSRLTASQPPKPTSRPPPFSKNGVKSTSTSPEKAKSQPFTKGTRLEKKSADLVTMFSRQAQRAPTVSPTKKDDIISDPISDDDDVGEHRAASTSRVGQNARKRFRDAPQSQPANGPAVMSSQKFLKPPRLQPDSSTSDEQRPWSERFGPINLDELAVHKKKVADVRRWFEDVMAGRLRQRLLILKGAAGTGKTTTVRLLAKDMRCELLEWRNPVGSLGANQGAQSASAQFEEFMGRGGKFGQLDIDLDSTPQNLGNKVDVHDNTRKLILIEEFPNTFTRSSTALTSFRNTILQYLASNTPSLSSFTHQSSADPITPVVIIISETLLTTTSASADSFTAHRLLGPEISRHPGCCTIEFNAIAPTLLAGALELVVQKEARKSGRRRTPGPLVLKRLGEIGDIRSAISSLEFLCLKGDTDTDWGSKVTFTKPKRGSKNQVSLTKGEVESLELVSQREASLGIFHAVGKVVYNKRDERPMSQQTPEGQAEMLPEYMAHYSRSKRSEVSVDSLIDETGTDTHTFISALHENYVLSCESSGPADPNSSLDYINDCIEYLSESDLLSPSWDVFFRGRGLGGSAFTGRDSGSQTLRQDEITFQVATRGLLFSLPNPVKRMKHAGRGGGDAYKMFYPTSLKLWREKEELEGVVDHWASKLLRGDETGQNVTQGASAFRRPKQGANGGEWINKQASQQRNNSQPSRRVEQSQDQSAPLLFLGSSARRELLLERLPYMAHIARGRRSSVSNVRLREIDKVVSFTGIGDAADEEAIDGDDNAEQAGEGEAWATDKPTEEASPRKKTTLGIRQKSEVSSALTNAASLPSVQKLVLSDDDIEDD